MIFLRLRLLQPYTKKNKYWLIALRGWIYRQIYQGLTLWSSHPHLLTSLEVHFLLIFMIPLVGQESESMLWIAQSSRMGKFGSKLWGQTKYLEMNRREKFVYLLLGGFILFVTDHPLFLLCLFFSLVHLYPFFKVLKLCNVYSYQYKSFLKIVFSWDGKPNLTGEERSWCWRIPFPSIIFFSCISIFQKVLQRRGISIK